VTGRRWVEQVERIFADYEALRKSGVTLQNGELKGMLKLVIADPAVTLKSLVDSGQAAVGGGEADGAAALAQPAEVCGGDRAADMTFGLGPAGTGKTYLAVAMAVSALMAKKVSRIILVRPAVEAGERLGFLPGSCRRRSIRICGRCTTRCTTCSTRRRWTSCWSRT
jgi:phosphate starvation-inducible PhoH-like protein